jgi:hypothetical protein
MVTRPTTRSHVFKLNDRERQMLEALRLGFTRPEMQVLFELSKGAVDSALKDAAEKERLLNLDDRKGLNYSSLKVARGAKRMKGTR